MTEPATQTDPAAVVDAPVAREPSLDAAFVRAIQLWEGFPHNREGSDRSWAERLVRETRQHLSRARPPVG